MRILPRSAALLVALSSVVAANDACEIRVIEKGSGWPVPMVELKTTHNVRFYTDNAGRIAFDLPEMLGKETWFHVSSPGYERRPDGFGNRGIRLTPKKGETLTVEIERTAIARRLGRLTGAGLFAESQKLGLEKDWRESGAVGCDSVQNALHDGKLYWAWGDTSVARYPLGIFHMTGATTTPRPLSSFEPPLKLRFNHFRNDTGALRPLCKMDGDGPTWFRGLVSLPDREGTQRLVCTYEKIRGSLTSYRAGLAVWNEETEAFEHLKTLWEKSAESPKKPRHLPEGHVTLWKDDDGKEWALFGDPFPHLRCEPTFEAWSDPTRWERIEAPSALRSPNEGKEIKPHRGAIAWNAFRKRWVTIFTQHFGKPSMVGEIWYAEADSPHGPWGKAIKVLSHPDYSFYNPVLHAEFTAEKPSTLLFEGTYTATFSGTKVPTPRYDYNQMLYRLDLDDPKLAAARE